ncbi:hypothetical protein K402DRAFT_416384 [Aulographum hederae CBS 113979]|uniref:Uncharacterized protein n=1 Tax=Aulographum hederae CBS 113979 TaxID=1176131 RepID=A0A6G1HG09_9PEZI|nr:hypothetical protein K402DRAFT_416384 [Aulographum hederae CBS 113979]
MEANGLDGEGAGLWRTRRSTLVLWSSGPLLVFNHGISQHVAPTAKSSLFPSSVADSGASRASRASLASLASLASGAARVWAHKHTWPSTESCQILKTRLLYHQTSTLNPRTKPSQPTLSSTVQCSPTTAASSQPFPQHSRNQTPPFLLMSTPTLLQRATTTSLSLPPPSRPLDRQPLAVSTPFLAALRPLSHSRAPSHASILSRRLTLSTLKAAPQAPPGS